MLLDAKEVRTLETTRLRSLVDADMETAFRLHAPDHQMIPPLGEAHSRERYLDRIGSGSFRCLIFEPEDAGAMAAVQAYDMFAVRYVAKVQFMLDDEPLRMLRVWHTDIYQRRDSAPQAVWSQATLIPSVDASKWRDRG